MPSQEQDSFVVRRCHERQAGKVGPKMSRFFFPHRRGLAVDGSEDPQVPSEVGGHLPYSAGNGLGIGAVDDSAG